MDQLSLQLRAYRDFFATRRHHLAVGGLFESMDAAIKHFERQAQAQEQEIARLSALVRTAIEILDEEVDCSYQAAEDAERAVARLKDRARENARDRKRDHARAVLRVIEGGAS